MNNKTLQMLPLTKEKHFLKLQLYYQKGGMNYFTGKVEARGIFLLAVPVEREDRGTYTSEVVTMFSGIKQLVLPMNKFSQKTFDSFVPSEEVVKKLTDHVLTKSNLTLA